MPLLGGMAGGLLLVRRNTDALKLYTDFHQNSSGRYARFVQIWMLRDPFH